MDAALAWAVEEAARLLASAGTKTTPSAPSAYSFPRATDAAMLLHKNIDTSSGHLQPQFMRLGAAEYHIAEQSAGPSNRLRAPGVLDDTGLLRRTSLFENAEQLTLFAAAAAAAAASASASSSKSTRLRHRAQPRNRLITQASAQRMQGITPPADYLASRLKAAAAEAIETKAETHDAHGWGTGATDAADSARPYDDDTGGYHSPPPSPSPRRATWSRVSSGDGNMTISGLISERSARLDDVAGIDMLLAAAINDGDGGGDWDDDDDESDVATAVAVLHRTAVATAGIAAEAGFLARLGLHQLASAASAVWALALRRGAPLRPSWPTHLDFMLHMLRTQLDFGHHTLARARRAQATVAAAAGEPAGCAVVRVRLRVDLRAIERLEDLGRPGRAAAGVDGFPVPREVESRADDGGGGSTRYYWVDGEWVLPLAGGAQGHNDDGDDDRPVILFIHGGAYVIGDVKVYRMFTSRLVQTTGHKLFAINYRLAPESPFPAALHDAFAAYAYLTGGPQQRAWVQQESAARVGTQRGHIGDTAATAWAQRLSEHGWCGVQSRRVAVVGDSAGGGLAMALLEYLRDYIPGCGGGGSSEAPLSMPGAAVLFSPWVDLTMSARSWVDNAGADWLPARARLLHEPLLVGGGGGSSGRGGGIGGNSSGEEAEDAADAAAAACSDGIAHPVYLYLLGGDRRRRLPVPARAAVDEVQAKLASVCRDVHELAAGSRSGSPPQVAAWFPRTLPDALALSSAALDDLRVRETVERMARHPLVSPLFAPSRRGWPPILVQAGGAEVLRDDAVRLARVLEASAAAEVGATGPGRAEQQHVVLEEYPDMVHVFVAMGEWLPESGVALNSARRFLGSSLERF